jgi:hypothetical protein
MLRPTALPKVLKQFLHCKTEDAADRCFFGTFGIFVQTMGVAEK